MALTKLGQETIAVNAALGSLATIAVFLRLLARRVKHLPPKADDYVILVVLVIADALCGLSIWAGVTGLFGDDILKMGLRRFAVNLKITFIDVILTQTCYGLIKISVLLFYKRLFNTKRFNLIANIFIGICIGFIIVMVLGQTFSKHPVDIWWNYPNKQYNPFLDPRWTFNYNIWMFTMQIINMFLDLTIVTLPVPIIRRLNLSTAKKLSLIAVFATGLFCIVASGVRIYWTWQLYLVVNEKISPLQSTAIFGWNNIWANIEVCCSIIAACMPTLVPLVNTPRILKEKLQSTFSQYSSLFSSLKSKKSGRSTDQRSDSSQSTVQMSKITATSSHHDKEISDGASSASDVEDHEEHIIRMEKSFGYFRQAGDATDGK